MSDAALAKTYLVNRTLVQIYLGDITTAEVGAVINAEHRDLEMDSPSGESVSAAIRRVGGEDIAAALKMHAPAELGDVITTHAGALPAKFVLHAAVVDEVGGRLLTTEQTIADATLNVLKRADSLGIRTLAFPAFGVGRTDIDDEVAARAMIGTVTRYLRGSTGLQRVVFALIQPSTFIAFFEAAVRDALQRESALELNVARNNGDLTFHFTGDGAVVSKSQAPYAGDELAAVNQRLRALAAQTAVGADDVAELRALGRHLHDSFFSDEVKTQLAASDVENLLLRLDESVMHIPWELAHDSQQFLCRRFNLGRQVVALQAAGSTAPPPADPPRRLLVAHNPTGDLSGSEREARLLLSHFDAVRCPWTVEALGHERLDPLSLALAMQEADIVHFSGHADPDEGGWLLAGGAVFGAERFSRLAHKPRLVFANACYSAGEGASGRAVLTLGHRFLLAGVQSFVGNLWTVPDVPATTFALAFYDGLLAGGNFGRALRLARERVAELPSAGAMAWAGYVFYGDPRWRLSL
jgi:O-acetyl-ADP-ribose deacetylase (regulator of RNase III)